MYFEIYKPLANPKSSILYISNKAIDPNLIKKDNEEVSECPYPSMWRICLEIEDAGEEMAEYLKHNIEVELKKVKCYYVKSRSEASKIMNLIRNTGIVAEICAPFSSPIFITKKDWPPFNRVRKYANIKKKNLPLGFSSLFSELKKMNLRKVLKIDGISNYELELLKFFWYKEILTKHISQKGEESFSINNPVETFLFNPTRLLSKPFLFLENESVKYSSKYSLFLSASTELKTARLKSYCKAKVYKEFSFGFSNKPLKNHLSSYNSVSWSFAIGEEKKKHKQNELIVLYGSFERLSKFLNQNTIEAETSEYWLSAITNLCDEGFLLTLPTFKPEVAISGSPETVSLAIKEGLRAEMVGKKYSSGYILKQDRKILVALDHFPSIKSIKTKKPQKHNEKIDSTTFDFDEYVISIIQGRSTQGKELLENGLKNLICEGGNKEKTFFHLVIFSPSRKIGPAIEGIMQIYHILSKYRIPILSYSHFPSEVSSIAIALISPKEAKTRDVVSGDFIYVSEKDVFDIVEEINELKKLNVISKTHYPITTIHESLVQIALNSGKGLEYEETSEKRLIIIGNENIEKILPVKKIGRVRGDKRFIIKSYGEVVFNKSLEELTQGLKHV